jgi:hypothetical protein
MTSFAQYVLDRNDAGDPFPLHAECLGFELVSMIVSSGGPRIWPRLGPNPGRQILAAKI